MIGVFGGSGFYSLIDDANVVKPWTPFGEPSDAITVGDIGGKRVAFLPRHGSDHRFPPHAINYRANVWAMRECGVTRLIAPTAAGSLAPAVAPGSLVVPDQIIDRTSGRRDTFFDTGPASNVVRRPILPAVTGDRTRGVERGWRVAGRRGHRRRYLGPSFLYTGRIAVVCAQRLGSCQYDAIPRDRSRTGTRHVLCQYLRDYGLRRGTRRRAWNRTRFNGYCA